MIKKLHGADKIALDAAVTIDLAGVRVFKFRMANQLRLLAYRQEDEQTLTLLAVGSHENFYRDIKRS